MRKVNLKKFRDILPPKSFKKDHTEFSSELADLHPTDVVKDQVAFSEMAKIARRTLSKKYSKKK